MMVLDVPKLCQFFFITIRLSTLLLLTPIQALRQLPVHARISMVSTLGLIFMEDIPKGVPQDALTLLLGGITECANGFIMACCIMLSFAAINCAGQLIDNTMGLNPTAVLNPQEHHQDAVSSHLLMMLSVLFFFSVDGHLWLFQGLRYSFTVIPPGQLALLTNTLPVIKACSFMWLAALMIASPVMLALFILDCAASLITRSMPQVNPYFLFAPIKIILGFILMMLMQQGVQPIMQFVLSAMFHTWQEVLS